MTIVDIDGLEMIDLDLKNAARLVPSYVCAVSFSSSSFAQSSAAHLLRSCAAAVSRTVAPNVPYVPSQDIYCAYDMFSMRETYHDPISNVVRRDREGIMGRGPGLLSLV